MHSENLKALFERIYAYAQTMEHPAIDDKGRCLYRSPHGPCLIGSIISDEVAEKCEGKGVFQMWTGDYLKVTYDESVFLSKVQNAHDTSYYFPDWKDRMMKRLDELKEELYD